MEGIKNIISLLWQDLINLIYILSKKEGSEEIIDYSKKLNTLFHCPLCMGFWCSMFLFCINDYTELFTFEYSLGNMFCLSCLGAGTTYLLSMIISDNGLRVSSRSGGDYVDD